MWNCIQIEEFDSNTGRLRRKLIFDEISNKRQTITKYRNVHFKLFLSFKLLKLVENEIYMQYKFG